MAWVFAELTEQFFAFFGVNHFYKRHGAKR